MWSSRQSQSLVNVSEKSCLHPARLRASSNLKKKYGRPDFLVVFFQVFCKKNTLCLLIYDIMVSFIIKWTSLKGAQLVQHRADSGLCGLYKQVGNKCSVSQLIIKLLWQCFCVMALRISVSTNTDNSERSNNYTAYIKFKIEK